MRNGLSGSMMMKMVVVGMMRMVGMRLSAVISRLGSEHNGDIGKSGNQLDDTLGGHTKTPPFMNRFAPASGSCTYRITSSLRYHFII